MTGRNNPQTAGDIWPSTSFNRSGERKPAWPWISPSKPASSADTVAPLTFREICHQRNASHSSKPALTNPHAEQNPAGAIQVGRQRPQGRINLRKGIHCRRGRVVGDDVFCDRRCLTGRVGRKQPPRRASRQCQRRRQAKFHQHNQPKRITDGSADFAPE